MGKVELTVNGRPLEVGEGTTVLDLLEELGLDGRGPVAVEVNRSIVPRTEHGRRVLLPGDRIELVTFVGGG